jgi:hypothetical protein
MAGILNDRPEASPPRKEKSCTSIVVGSQRFSNSAAKFWPSLLDEIQPKYPGCSRIELTASCCGALEARRLHPEIELQESIAELMHCNLKQVVRDTIAALELFGPPGPVEVRLMADQREILRSTLPIDTVDAEIFPYLLVWLLKWADIPERDWNNPRIDGHFVARDTRRDMSYEITFTLENRHLSEGLYRRTLILIPPFDESL